MQKMHLRITGRSIQDAHSHKQPQPIHFDSFTQLSVETDELISGTSKF